MIDIRNARRDRQLSLANYLQGSLYKTENGPINVIMLRQNTSIVFFVLKYEISRYGVLSTKLSYTNSPDIAVKEDRIPFDIVKASY